MLGSGPVSEVFRPVAEGNLALFEAARTAGAARFIILASLNSEACRNEFEVGQHVIAPVQTVSQMVSRAAAADAAVTT